MSASPPVLRVCNFKFTLKGGNMARNLKPGDNVNGYTIVNLLNVGGMAVSYAAETGSGEKAFLKQYKSPSVTLDWYRDYVNYQKEIKKRIEASPILRTMTVRFVDTFEAKAGPLTYFQVFEFVKAGEDLEQILKRIKDNPTSFTWEQRLLFAKVIMTCINGIHSAGIIHCDLKPPNLQLFKDSEVKTGYRLKLIDMDFSILKDRKAPWHGKEGYVGSPGYFSPEHLRGEIPQTASDVFTCGLILYDLLSIHGHPYHFDDDISYKDAVLGRTAPVPTLAGITETDSSAIAQMLFSCLSPNPAERPTAGEILDTMNGISSPLASVASPVAVTTPDASTTPGVSEKLELKSESGTSLFFSIKTQVGKNLCRGCGSDSQFMDTHQFTVERNSAGEWVIAPNTSSTNETLLNGKALSETVSLRSEDIISVGRESKSIAKLPLTVRFS